MAIDPKLIDDLNSRRKKVILSGGQEKIVNQFGINSHWYSSS